MITGRVTLVNAMQLGDVGKMSYGELEYLTTAVAVIHKMPLPQHPLVRVFHDHRDDTYRVTIDMPEYDRVIVPEPPFSTLAAALLAAAGY